MLISVTATKVQLVVRYTMRPSARTDQLFAALDGNRDGRLTLPTEQLGQAALLVPRARRGLTLLIDGVVTRPKLEQTKFRVLTTGKRRGLETLLLLQVPLSAGPHRITLKVNGDLTTVEAQVSGVTRVGTSLSVRPDDPVVGPSKIADGEAWVEVDSK